MCRPSAQGRHIRGMCQLQPRMCCPGGRGRDDDYRGGRDDYRGGGGGRDYDDRDKEAGVEAWARVAGMLFLTFVAAGDRYLLAVNWTAKFATTGAPFSLRISESSSAKPGNFHTMEDAGVRVADQRDARALHKRTTGCLFSFDIRHSYTSDCDYACFATGICILLLRRNCRQSG
ncbi:hypothetical protein B0H13DRAFT_1876780 [Mycena leptocephala]|nr:hypothetical protein B0H13DRAFT_1876780 [Mycena leptocephala]